MSRADVPDVLYSLASRLGAVRAVVFSVDQAIPVGEAARPILRELETVGRLMVAADELLALCDADCEALEMAFLGKPEKKTSFSPRERLLGES